MQSAAGQRHLPLDGLRALAFGAVLLEHVFALPLLWSGVDLFFVISGYLITGILLRAFDSDDAFLARFYWRRTTRIWPAYYACIAATVLLLPTAADNALWASVFAGNFWTSASGLDGPLAHLWSLAVEEQFYLLWPLALLVTPLRYRTWLFVGLLVAAPLIRAGLALAGWEFAAYTLLPARMDALMGGALLADFQHRRGAASLARLRRPAWSFAPVAFCIFAGSAMVSAHDSVLYAVLAFEAWAFYACILVIVLTQAGWLARALSWRPLVYVGRISYGLYLFHLPVIYVLRDRGVDGVALLVLAGAVSLLLAAASWRYFEAPVMAWGRRQERARATGGAPDVLQPR